MSIWISDPRRAKILFSLAALTVLAACGAARFGKSANTSFAARSTTISVANKPVVIEGPRGFCVDRQSSETGGDTAFVLLGNCKVISPGFTTPAPRVRALLTASVSSNSGRGQEVAADGVNLDQFFRSETGRTALSRSSDPGTVQILDTFARDGAFFLRARDTSKGIVPGASDDYWRAFFNLRDQVASVSVIGFRSDPLPPEKGLATTKEFTRLLRLRNGAPAPVAAPVQPVVPTQVAAADPPPPAVSQEPLVDTTTQTPAETVPPTETRTETQAQTQAPAHPIVKIKRRNPFWSIGLLRKLVN